ncbi:hypothetical protein CK503_00005, partial [Aliifodinibius salipaludis]
MRKLISSIFLVLFLTGCFSSPYVDPNTGSTSISSVEEPEKMEPCNYNSLDGKEIILSKSPKRT